MDEEGGLKLQCLWKLRDFKCGVELVNRIYKVTEATDHFPNIHLEQPNQVRAELWTSSIGKLCISNFPPISVSDSSRQFSCTIARVPTQRFEKFFIYMQEA